MNLEKNLKNIGRGVLGAVAAVALFISCDNGTTSTDSVEPAPTIQTGDIKGNVVYPNVENNQIVLRPRNNVNISVDGIEKSVSDGDGNFYIQDITQGFRELRARYNKDYSASFRIFVVKDQVNYFSDIQINPTSPEGEIVCGTIYTDSTKVSKYVGQLDLIFSDAPKSTNVSSDGKFAFKGYVDGAQLMTGDNRRVKFLNVENPDTILLGNYWMVDLEAYVSN